MTTAIFTLIGVLVGYVIGIHARRPEDIKAVQESINKRIKKTKAKNQKLGAINTLSARELAMKGTKAEEEEIEMTKLLDEHLKDDVSGL